MADEGLLSQPDPRIALAARTEGRVLLFARVAPWNQLAGCVVIVGPDRVRVRRADKEESAKK